MPELLKKYGARRFPSFYYVKPETNAKVATRFTFDREYEEMYKWMNKLITIHGGVKYGEEEELLNIHPLEDEDGDDELISEEEIQFDGYDLEKLSAQNALKPKLMIQNKKEVEDKLDFLIEDNKLDVNSTDFEKNAVLSLKKAVIGVHDHKESLV